MQTADSPPPIWQTKKWNCLSRSLCDTERCGVVARPCVVCGAACFRHVAMEVACPPSVSGWTAFTRLLEHPPPGSAVAFAVSDGSLFACVCARARQVLQLRLFAGAPGWVVGRHEALSKGLPLQVVLCLVPSCFPGHCCDLTLCV